MTRNMFFIGLFAMALGLWFLAPFSWLKAKIDEDVERKEAEWKREDKKDKKKKNPNKGKTFKG